MKLNFELRIANCKLEEFSVGATRKVVRPGIGDCRGARRAPYGFGVRR